MAEDYYIKDGYHPNKQALTFEADEIGIYWTNNRIKMSAAYQYYVYQECLNLLQGRGDKSLLDVGCGPPVKIKRLLAPYCHDIVLIDQPSLSDLVQQILPQSQFISANLEHIAFDLQRKFGLIICADVLEHLLTPDNCLKFIRQHLAPNGLAILSTPERDYIRDKACNYSPKPEHVREWNSGEFARYVSSHGFEIVEHLLTPQKKLNPVAFFIYRLLSPFIRIKRWSTCQVIICRLEG